jgi:ribosome-interacting GTPase 1
MMSAAWHGARYIRCLYVYNKVDMLYIEEIDQLARRQHSIVISCNAHFNLDLLLEERTAPIDSTQSTMQQCQYAPRLFFRKRTPR